MMKDVLPMMFSTLGILVAIKNINIDFFSFGRVELFMILVSIGGVVLMVNSLLAKDVRNMILKRLNK